MFVSDKEELNTRSNLLKGSSVEECSRKLIEKFMLEIRDVCRTGGQFSSGQKLKIAIARVILKIL